MITAAHATLHLVAWRHPKPVRAQGRCIGQTDLPLDRRKAKRLAHRIRQVARRHQWPRVVYTSPLQRCALVGRQLKRWGWRHHVDAALLEMHFGQWDGCPWHAIPLAQIDQWCGDFLHARPGGGEALHGLFQRTMSWLQAHAIGQGDQACAPTGPAQPPLLIVAHAGWMQVAAWLASGQPWPTQASQWPSPAPYGAWRTWQLPAPRSQP